MAAGLGFKTFTTGEVLTAGDVNGYLMQGVLVFASNAARDAAITAPAEGQFAFTKDTNGLWFYDGAAWVSSGATGDIEGVTAGIGISGGGTSGTVTVTNSMATAIDAKGDLIAGTGADTFDRLAVGANNTILTADSSTATGLKWAAPAGGGGKVLQVVTGYITSISTVTSLTFTNTSITLSITPSLSSSKVMVFIAASCNMFASSINQVGMGMQITRGVTPVFTGTSEDFYVATGSTGSHDIKAVQSLSVLDAPATTSSTTYTFQIRAAASGVTARVNNASRASTITLMEIGA